MEALQSYRKYLTWRSALIALFALFALILILSVAFIFKLVMDVDEKFVVGKKSSSIEFIETKLDAETIVNRKDLVNYLRYAHKVEDAEEFLATYIGNIIALENGKIEIVNNISFPKLLINDCKRYRCLQHSIGLESIPPVIWQALMGVEDYRFMDHAGVDFISLMRALLADLRSMSLAQGGSTITQQLVKNLFLTEEKKITRKIKELLIALYIEARFSKEEIMTTYLNEVFWGAIGGVYIKGIDMASRTYFGKTLEALSSFEASILIGLLKGPTYYSPVRNIDRLILRTNIVWDKLLERGIVNPSEYKWTDRDWKNFESKMNELNNSSDLLSIYAVKPNLYFNPFQEFVFIKSVNNFLNDKKEKMQDTDLAVKALILSKDCAEGDCYKSYSFYSKDERSLEVAIENERHQVGSILKPIIYHFITKNGKELSDFISTAPITINVKSGPWTPKEVSATTVEEMTLREALQKSKNIPLIRLASEIGFDVLEEGLSPWIPRLLKPLREYPSELLGAIELNMQEIGDVYLKFLKDSCELIQEDKIDEDESVLFAMTDAELTTVRSNAKEFVKNLSIFGKTGTTNQGLDNWYVGIDKKNITIIWVGVETGRENKNYPFGGASTSFRIFQDYIQFNGQKVESINCD